MKLLLPKTDVIFKLLFGDSKNKNILRGHPDDKLGILDVKVTTASGHVLDIEIQVLPLPEMKSSFPRNENCTKNNV